MNLINDLISIIHNHNYIGIINLALYLIFLNKGLDHGYCFSMYLLVTDDLFKLKSLEFSFISHLIHIYTNLKLILILGTIRRVIWKKTM